MIRQPECSRKFHAKNTDPERSCLNVEYCNENIKDVYHELFDDFISSYFESGEFEQEYYRVFNMISDYVYRDPTKFCTYEEFLSGSDTLRRFCLLRSESIRGQLEGRIPSTSDGQSENSDALIDASDIEISAMGSMGLSLIHI